MRRHIGDYGIICSRAIVVASERNNEMTRKLLMMAVVAAAAAFGAWAETEPFGGYTWTYRINGETAEILV